MPFTFSHTSVVILFKPWLNQKRLSLTGLVLGCMAPDFEYFLRMRVKGDIGHSFEGIFLFNIPISILIALLIHLFIRDPFIEHLPKIIKERFIIYQNNNWLKYLQRNFLIVIFSILIGIFTHIIWDAFTHKTGYFVEKIKFLNASLYLAEFQIYVYKIFQYMSSILGLVVVIYYIYKMPAYEIEIKKNQKINQYCYWISVMSIFCCLFGIWFSISGLAYSFGHILVAMISCLFWSIFVISLFFKLYKARI